MGFRPGGSSAEPRGQQCLSRAAEGGDKSHCGRGLLEPLPAGKLVKGAPASTSFRFLCDLETFVVSLNLFCSLPPFFAASSFVGHFWKCFPM